MVDAPPPLPPSAALAVRILSELGPDGGPASSPGQAARLVSAVEILLGLREISAPLALDLLRRLLPLLPGLPSGQAIRGAMVPARLSPRFIITQPLGAGGRGAVFKAIDLVRLEAGAATHHVAVKLGDAGTEQTVRRLFAEWRHAEALAHPAIIAIHDVVREGAHVFAVMDYVPGEDLKALIARAAPPDRRIITGIIEQIGGALAFCHGLHRIHGDVKPANIILAPDGRATLVDLSSMAVLSHIQDGRWVGGSEEGPIEVTPRYASPERLAGDTADPADDIYAFAVLICEMLGAYPFAEARPGDDPRMRIPEVPGDLSRAARRALLRALASRRRDRWHDMAEFLKALRLPL
jgi:serine/threonine protein kinase